MEELSTELAVSYGAGRSGRLPMRAEADAMNMSGFILLVITAICMAGANLLMKAGISRAGGFDPSLRALAPLCREPTFLLGFAIAGFASLMWFRILATQKLSTCYPLFVSLTYLLITVAAFYFLHERISLQKVAGLAAIIVGITAVARA
jgi:multidrug transporter EmrE-like cation transporter